MKPSALFAFFFFHLFAFTTTTTTTAQDVIDTDGNWVRNGGRYYLNPIGSGITIAPIWDANFTSCSLTVVDVWANGGREIALSHLIKIAYLQTHTPLHNLAFTDLPSNLCTNNSNWVITRSDSVGKPVMVGSAQEFGDAVVHGSFHLEFLYVVRDMYFYKLVFCEDGKECKNIGIHFDSNSLRRLVVTDKEPLMFQVRKAQRSFSSDLSKVV